MIRYEVVQLDDINLGELDLVKETWLPGDPDHTRWVFRSRPSAGTGRLYYKIWNPTYLRRNLFLQGVECGFYDESTTPALQALIFSRGICRGYVMHRCQPNRRKAPAFYEGILEKTARTGFFAVQYSRFHTMKYGEKYSLVDLEGVHPLSDLPVLASRYRCFFDDPDYERFVIELYCRTFPTLEAPQPARPAHSTGQPSSPGLHPFRKARSLAQSLLRWCLNRYGTVFNHVERIEK